MRRDANYPFYGWLLIVGVVAFGLYLLWDFKLIHHLIREDITYLSSFILVLFVAVSFYLGLAAWRLSRQRSYTLQLLESPLIVEGVAPESWALEYLQLMHWAKGGGKQDKEQTSNESEPLLARLVEQIHQGHNSGWFLSDILMRLGLIGTVIGFVLMLSSVYELKEGDVDALQQLLATMGSGMQVALYTTLTGLGAALLVGIQCQWLDRCADSLVSQIIKLGIKSDFSFNNHQDNRDGNREGKSN